MRKLLNLTVAGLLALTLGACDEKPTTPDVSASQHPGNSVGTVTLYELDENGERAGVMGTIRIQDTGSELIVQGNAQGFEEPDNFFTSLFYGVGSVSTGPLACLPTGLDLGGGVTTPGDAEDRLSQDEMTTAPWQVTRAGTGKLTATKDEHYVPVTDIGTISIRDLTEPAEDRTGALQGGELVACGKVQVNPGG